MSNAEKFLKAKGLSCTIKRTPVVSSKVSMKRSTKSSRDLGSREAYWEGLILLDASLASGEVMTIGVDDYLVQSANYDPASSSTAFFAAKSNAVLQHKRLTETEVSGNVVVSWVAMNASVTAYTEVVTSKLRQEDPGLLDQTRYVAQIPKSFGAVKLDRMILEGSNYQIESINSAGLRGVSIIQLGTDVRPD